MAKLLTQRASFELMDECLQIHGGAGYMREYWVERAARDARLGPIGGGSDEIMREILGRVLALCSAPLQRSAARNRPRARRALMSGAAGSDSQYVALDAVRTPPYAPSARSSAAAALLALCVGCCAMASTAPALRRVRCRAPPAAQPARRGPRPPSLHCARPRAFTRAGKPTGTAHRAATASLHRRRHARRTPRRAAPRSVAAQRRLHRHALRPATPTSRWSAPRRCAWSTANARSRGESALHAERRPAAAAQAHTEDMASGDYFEHDRPPRRHAAVAHARRRLHLQLAHRLRSRREHRLGHALAGHAAARSSPPGWPRRDTARTSSTRRFRDTGIGVSPHPLASLARGQAGAIYTQDFGVIIAPLAAPRRHRPRACRPRPLRALG